jgi:nucleotide-binding universal stress UspA family protein
LFASILCAVDFSDTSRQALALGAHLAERLQANLRIVTVGDPLLVQAAAGADDVEWVRQETAAALRNFVAPVLAESTIDAHELIVAVGTPAPTILEIARAKAADLLVVGTQGLSGYQKLFFGSVTTALLRQTDRPVLVSPPVDASSASLRSSGGPTLGSGCVLAPVDLADRAPGTLRRAAQLAAVLDGSLLLLNVVCRVRGLDFMAERLATYHHTLRDSALEALRALAEELADTVHTTETMVRVGDPAEEIAAVAQEHAAQMIVMGLRRHGVLGPQPGSTAYRVLCLARTPVLVLPPDDVPSR